jgi:hypothetical protein
MFANLKQVKLGSMRKARDWTLYPQSEADKTNNCIIIQCNNRIARVNLDTKRALLSDGKGGHQGFIKLSPLMGATAEVVPDAVIEQLRILLIRGEQSKEAVRSVRSADTD